MKSRALPVLVALSLSSPAFGAWLGDVFGETITLIRQDVERLAATAAVVAKYQAWIRKGNECYTLGNYATQLKQLAYDAASNGDEAGFVEKMGDSLYVADLHSSCDKESGVLLSEMLKAAAESDIYKYFPKRRPLVTPLPSNSMGSGGTSLPSP